MKRVNTEVAARAFLGRVDAPVVFVPTMGALHVGHQALMQHARKLAGTSGTVVVSIFVNPMQFGPNEDLDRYPRPLTADLALCRNSGVDLVFTPDVASLVPADASVTVVEDGRLSAALCGRSRPGHFQGVCTIVAKLFHIVSPTIAIFGEKDWQQLAILRRMVRDLNFPIKLVGHPIVREADGLAVSSRNRYLSEEQRAQAPKLFESLRVASSHRTASAIVRKFSTLMKKVPDVEIEYIEVVDPVTLRPVRSTARGALVAAAVRLGNTRLIDNILIRAENA